MKELLFLRHAKSSWEHGVTDRHRPLQSKGMKAIISVAQYYKSNFQSFDCMLSSPANRAFHTAAILAHEIDFPLNNFLLREDIYTYDSERIIALSKELDERWNKVILVGHNPAFTEAASHFSANATPELKTSDWVHLKFAQKKWKDIAKGDSIYGSKKEAQKVW